MLFRIFRIVALGALPLLASCAGETTGPVTPTRAAGVYVLSSVSGRGPTGGMMTLGSDATVERRVVYEWGSDPIEYVVSGSYQVDASGVRFALREMAGATLYIWPVRGEWRGTGFAITYPDAADGPDIVETYRRLP